MSEKCPRCELPGVIAETVKESSDGPQNHNRRCPNPKCNETWKHVPAEPPFNPIRLKGAA